MAHSSPWAQESPLDYFNHFLKLGMVNQRDHIEMYTNKEYLLNQFKLALKEDDPTKHNIIVFSTLPRDPEQRSPGLNVQLKPENRVDIITLTKSLGKVLVGKFFLGRVLVNAYQLRAIAFVVEDPSGEKAVRVYAYNSHYHYKCFREGSFVLIMNPYLKENQDGGLGLRSDLDSEVIILNGNNMKSRFPYIVWKSLSKTNSDGDTSSNGLVNKADNEIERQLAKFKSTGNKHFAAGNFIAAIASYTEGLSLCTRDRDLLSNRAFCYLKMENYLNAVKDASLCLKKNPMHVKAIYRLAKAHIGLKDYNKAKNILEEKLKTGVPKGDLRALLQSTNEYIAQRDIGQYDMTKLYVSMGKAVVHDVTDYVGPLKVVDVGSKGRGLIVTEDVQPGQLLLSAKAFAIHFSEDNTTKLNNSPNASGRSLLNIIERKITEHPEFGKELYALTAGKDLGHLNADSDDCTKVDTMRIENIIKINGVKFMGDETHCEGLWILQSYINNDCFNCNASVTLFGDVSQVRCIKPLKAGDEILILYRERACSLSDRVISFQEKDLICKCDLCRFESREPEDRCILRDALLRNYYDDTYRHPKQLERIVKKLRDISKDSPYVEHYVAMPQLSLANIYNDVNDVNKAIENFEEFLRDWERYGGDITFHLHRASAELFYLYFRKSDMVNAKKWRERLREYVILNYGSYDDCLVEAMHPGIIKCFAEINS